MFTIYTDTPSYPASTSGHALQLTGLTLGMVNIDIHGSVFGTIEFRDRGAAEAAPAAFYTHSLGDTAINDPAILAQIVAALAVEDPDYGPGYSRLEVTVIPTFGSGTLTISGVDAYQGTFYFTVDDFDSDSRSGAYKVVNGESVGHFYDGGTTFVAAGFGGAMADGNHILWGEPQDPDAGSGWKVDTDLNSVVQPFAAWDASFYWLAAPSLAAELIRWNGSGIGDMSGIAVIPDTGDVWVAESNVSDLDTNERHLLKFDRDGVLQHAVYFNDGLFYSGLFSPGMQYAKQRNKLYIAGLRNGSFNQCVIEYDIATDTWGYNESIPDIFGSEFVNIAWDEDRGRLWVYDDSSADWDSTGTYTCRAFALDPDTVDWSGAGSVVPTPADYCDLILDDSDGPFFTDVTCARVIPGQAAFLLDAWSNGNRVFIVQPMDGSPPSVAGSIFDIVGYNVSTIFDIWFDVGSREDFWLRLNQREDGLGNRLNGGNAPRIITRSTGNAKSVQRGLRVQTRNGKGYS